MMKHGPLHFTRTGGTKKMRWELLDRGFLPTPDPLTKVEAEGAAHVEALAARLPELVYAGRFRETAKEVLSAPLDLSSVGDGPGAERLFKLFSYFASAYVHLPGAAPASVLPKEI